MPAEHETMTAEQIEALKIWAPYWSDADCRKALATIEAQAATIASLESALAVAREALEPFAKIPPSAFYAEDGSERERYQVMLQLDHSSRIVDFNGHDLATARTALLVLDAALKGARPAQGGE